MYKKRHFIILMCFALHCFGQTLPSLDKIDGLLINEQIEEAVELVIKNGHKDLYVYGRKLADQGHVDTALNWFVQLTLKYGNAEHYYGRAWVHWVRQEIGDARHCAEYIVANGAPKLILARAHHLLGLITFHDLEYGIANDHADKCEGYYRELGKNGGLYLVYILRASIAVRSEDFEAGKRHIKTALGYNEKIRTNPYSLGRAYELYSEMSFLTAHYDTAIDFAEKSRDEYFKANMQNNGWSLSGRTGLCNALLGDFGTAYDIAKKVEIYARDNSLHKLLVYNHCTWIYMNRCRGVNYSVRLEEVNRWVNMKKSGKELSDLIKFVLAAQCPKL